MIDYWYSIFFKDTGSEPLPAVFSKQAEEIQKGVKDVYLKSTCVLQGHAEFEPMWYLDATW